MKCMSCVVHQKCKHNLLLFNFNNISSYKGKLIFKISRKPRDE